MAKKKAWSKKKFKNCLDILACRWSAIYRWKALNDGYNVFLDLTSIGGLQKKIMGL
jgi:hypothetical protein